MAGLIPQWFIDDLLNRADVVELIDSRVPLKKAGHEFKACCPFHNEKTPSFTVSPSKQFYHCFGCGAHGTAISFLMEYEHMDFVEAIESLAAHMGIEVPREQSQGPGPDGGSDDLYRILAQCSDYYRLQLKQNQPAIDYLKSRGLSGEIVAEYQMGYAPAGWDKLTKTLGTDSHDVLLKSGMLIAKEDGKTYDRFRERVMFPIRDRRGRMIAFGGRTLGVDSGAKYLNSPETPIFHKGKELYGLYEARQAVRKLETFYVVEGYMDVIALAQNGVRNVVATLGTATTLDHLKQLFRIVPEIIFCFDGDRAGRDAAWRALENALPVMRDGRIIRFMFLPEGEDPDSMIRRHGKVEFERLTTRSQTLSDYFFEKLSSEVDMTSKEGRSRLAKLAQPLLQKLPGGVFHETMVNELSTITELTTEQLVKATQLDQEPPILRPKPTRPAKHTPIRRLITLILHQPELAHLAEEPAEIAQMEVPGAELLSELLIYLQDSPKAHAGTILEHWRNSPHGEHLSQLAQTPINFLEEHQYEAQFKGELERLDAYRPLNPKQLASKLARGETLTPEEKDILKAAAAK